MIQCPNCGAQLNDGTATCPNCGAPVGYTTPAQGKSTLKTLAKVFMIIGCVLSAFEFLIPLCWTIPMTVHYCRAIKENRPVGVGFKVCSMLFVSMLGGIFMLCDHN